MPQHSFWSQVPYATSLQSSTHKGHLDLKNEMSYSRIQDLNVNQLAPFNARMAKCSNTPWVEHLPFTEHNLHTTHNCYRWDEILLRLSLLPFTWTIYLNSLYEAKHALSYEPKAAKRPSLKNAWLGILRTKLILRWHLGDIRSRILCLWHARNVWVNLCQLIHRSLPFSWPQGIPVIESSSSFIIEFGYSSSCG